MYIQTPRTINKDYPSGESRGVKCSTGKKLGATKLR